MKLLQYFAIAVVLALALGIGYFHTEVTAPLPEINVENIAKDGGRWIKLRDSRILEYFISGPETFDKVVIVVHGYTMTGKSIKELFEIENHGAATGITLIAPTMPGNGYSTPHLNRTLQSFAMDIKELVDALGIRKFSVAGYSYGGSHASAIAYYLSDQVNNVALIYSVSETYFTHLPLRKRIGLYILDIPVLGDVLLHLVQRRARTHDIDFVNKVLYRAINEDFAEAEGPYQVLFAKDFARSMQYSLEGFRTRVRLADGSIEPWPFKLSELQKENRKIYVYGAELDGLVPFASLSHFSEHLPGVVIDTSNFRHLYIFKRPKFLVEIVEKLI